MAGRPRFDGRLQRIRDGSQSVDSHPVEPVSVHQRGIISQVLSLGRRRQWQEALAIFAGVEEPHPRLRNAALNACTKSFEIDAAQTIFNEMPLKTLPAYNCLLVMFGRMRRIMAVEALMKEMTDQDLKPDATTYGTLIVAYGMTHDVEAVLQILADALSAGMPATPIMYGSAMAACAKAGDKERTAQLLEEMQAAGLEPDLGHCTSMIVACARDGDESGARQAFDDLCKRSIQPDIVTYTSLMGCFAGEGALPKAQGVLAEMQEACIAPDSFVYNKLLNIAVNSREVESCHAILKEMDSSGLKHNRETELCLRKLQDLEERLESDTIPSLPPGWHQTLDPASGHTYYWQSADPAGTTTWQRPAGPAV